MHQGHSCVCISRRGSFLNFSALLLTVYNSGPVAYSYSQEKVTAFPLIQAKRMSNFRTIPFASATCSPIMRYKVYPHKPAWLCLWRNRHRARNPRRARFQSLLRWSQIKWQTCWDYTMFVPLALALFAAELVLAEEGSIGVTAAFLASTRLAFPGLATTANNVIFSERATF